MERKQRKSRLRNYGCRTPHSGDIGDRNPKSPRNTKKRDKTTNKIAGRFGVENLLIITKHEEQTINTGMAKITAIPFWKFALDPSKYISQGLLKT